jgi:cystathionine beta-lyase
MASKAGFDFDTLIPRQGTHSVKWENLQAQFGTTDVLPLWVADMDFAVPEAVSRTLIERASHPIYGYNTQDSALRQSIVQWVKRRHQWDIQEEWILLASGVVPAFTLAILALSNPGDGVLIQPPVYHPFFYAIRDNERVIVENPLISKNGRYEMDFDDLEQKLAAGKSKLLLFCSPHNPVGRVWTKQELTTLSELCQKYGANILSDEIHNDLVFRGHPHTVLASLGTPVGRESVTFMAASKTFNLAGLNFSFMVIPSPQKRALIDGWLNRLHIRRNNLFGALATEAAFREGDAWLDALLPYLEGNADTIVEFVQQRLSGVKVVKPEGTYLAWLDFRAHIPDPKELDRFLVQKAKVGLNRGEIFGRQGEGFARLNFAAPRSRVLEALRRIEGALHGQSKG